MAHERLHKETANALATLTNSLATRRDHPTYGYTKRRIQDEWSFTQGLLTAWLIVTGKWDFPGGLVFTREMIDAVNAAFAFDFSDMAARVLNC